LKFEKDYFYFKGFKLYNKNAALKINTDAVLLGCWAKLNDNDKVLDVGTGGGVISFMLAFRFPKLKILGIDIDRASIVEANANIDLNKTLGNDIQFKQIRYQDYSSKYIATTFNHIISNPPYFNRSTKPLNDLSKSAKHTDNLSVNDFWESSAKLLSNNGLVSLIIPSSELNEHVNAAQNYDFHISRICKVRMRKEGAVKRALLEFSVIKKQLPIHKELIIHEDGQHHYSEAYKNLTKNFYLNF